MPRRNIKEQEHVRKAELRALGHAARQGFDEINQGEGIPSAGKKALGQLFKEIEAEAATKAAREGE